MKSIVATICACLALALTPPCRAQSTLNLPTVLPPGYDTPVSYTRTAESGREGTRQTCTATYSLRHIMVVINDCFPASYAGEVISDDANRSGGQPITTIGDHAYIQRNDAGRDTYLCAFSRGRYVVMVSVDSSSSPTPVTCVLVDDMSKLIDDKLKAWSPGSSNQQTGSQGLQTSVTCDTSAMAGGGQVVCLASTSGAGSNARITYSWSVDGANQTGITGNKVGLNGLGHENHIIVAVAHDSATGRVSSPGLIAIGPGGFVAGQTSESVQRSTPTQQPAPPAPPLGSPAAPSTTGAPTPAAPSPASPPASTITSLLGRLGYAFAIGLVFAGIGALFKLITRPRQKQSVLSVQAAPPPQYAPPATTQATPSAASVAHSAAAGPTAAPAAPAAQTGAATAAHLQPLWGPFTPDGNPALSIVFPAPAGAASGYSASNAHGGAQ